LTMNGTSPSRVKFGPFEADLHTHEIWKHGVKIKLVGQPFEVLAILLSRPGELITREELRERLWPGDTFVDFDHGLNAAVNKLREALSDSVETPKYVETLPRRGYRFVAVAAKRADQPTQAVPVQVRPPTSVESELPPPSTPEPAQGNPPHLNVEKPSRWWLYVSGATLVVLIAFAIAISFLLRENSFDGHTHAGGTATQRIRPLTNLADETSEPAFSPDGNFVAFRRRSDRPGVSGIYVKSVDSEEVWQVTNAAGACCPAWAPDGRTIAFARFSDNNEVGIFLAPALRQKEMPVDFNGQKLSMTLSGSAKKLDTQGVNPKRGELAWSPDGKSLAFSSTGGIALLSMERASVRRLTSSPPLSEDWGPTFSADGERILFVRNNEAGIPEEILSVSKAGGDTTRIVSQHSQILGPPQWSVDGQSVIFATDFGSHPGLWRAPVETKDAPAQINDSGWYPAVSRRGYKLAYQRITHSLNIWELELNGPGSSAARKEQRILVSATSETDQGPGPQISPDGKKLAFMSDRSGTMEIWTSDRDGSNPVQLTAVGGAGTPRWSPDSESIVFDAAGRNATRIYKIKLGESEPQLLTPDDSENRCPSWSRDGKWIYFASTRTQNGYQVWKVPADGGAPIQVTKQGGHAALESADGKTLYYAKTPYANPEIWQVPVDGGPEKLVSANLRTFTWASWGVTDQGIVFAGPSGTRGPLLRLFEPTSHKVTNLGELNTVPFWLGVSRDGKSAVFDQPGWQQSQIMLVENFR
jgi:Tol biopolymer transport system component/DNA-binding winged helix-turn-helix (wHTH) protein